MDIVDFFRKAIRLKDVQRTGWVHKGIPHPESVAHHSWGVALLALIIPTPPAVDRERLVAMALIHDLGEIAIGDWVWEKGAYSDVERQKKKHEHELAFMNNTLIGEQRELGIEFIEQQTPTAKFLKELDKLDMVFQALEYEKRVPAATLDEFWENAEKYITTPSLKEILATLKLKRTTPSP
ncbi:MAG: HD family hydrolase [archaeon]